MQKGCKLYYTNGGLARLLEEAETVQWNELPEKERGLTDGKGNFWNSPEKYLAETAEENRQNFLFVAIKNFFKLDAEDIINSAFEEFLEDIDTDAQQEDIVSNDLYEAIQKFNEQNRHIFFWEIYDSQKVTVKA